MQFTITQTFFLDLEMAMTFVYIQIAIKMRTVGQTLDLLMMLPKE